jgi:ABC-type transporter Mla MlaB component
MNEPQVLLVPLPADFSQPALAQLQLTVNEEIGREMIIQLDAKPVERIDGAALQFLIAFAESGHASCPAVLNESELIIAGFLDFGIDEATLNRLFDRTSVSASICA